MLLLKMLLCLGLSGWLIASTYRRLFRGAFGRGWRVWFVVLICVGVVVGFRLMNIQSVESPSARAYGVPFVIAGGELIDGHWRDGGVGRYMPLPLLADLAFGIAACVMPLELIRITPLAGKRCRHRPAQAWPCSLPPSFPSVSTRGDNG